MRLRFMECQRVLNARLQEPAPGKIQLLTGPRQVGKTTLLLSLVRMDPRHAMYVALDAPEADLPLEKWTVS